MVTVINFKDRQLLFFACFERLYIFVQYSASYWSAIVMIGKKKVNDLRVGQHIYNNYPTNIEFSIIETIASKKWSFQTAIVHCKLYMSISKSLTTNAKHCSTICHLALHTYWNVWCVTSIFAMIIIINILFCI